MDTAIQVMVTFFSTYYTDIAMFAQGGLDEEGTSMGGGGGVLQIIEFLGGLLGQVSTMPSAVVISAVATSQR